MSAPVDVLAVVRQMQANSSHFRNGLPMLADHHDGEFERELAAIAAIAELLEAAEDHLNGEDQAAWADTDLSATEAREREEPQRIERLRAALARCGGAS